MINFSIHQEAVTIFDYKIADFRRHLSASEGDWFDDLYGYKNPSILKSFI
jgi:hypothetical protein